MAEFIESADYSQTFSEVVSVTKEFEFDRMIQQFTIVVEQNCDITWTGNTGTLTIFSGESFSLPIRTKKITLTPSASGFVRIIGISKG